MKAIGIVRRVDQLGRIVLPAELRETLGIQTGEKKGEGDPLEIYVDGEYIILKKYAPACIFCGNAKNVKHIHDKNVCENCLEELKSL